MKHGPRNDYTIRAAARVCDMLDFIQRNPEGFSLTQVIDATNVPKSTAYRYLTTLEDRRYVTRDPSTDVYRIGPAFIPLHAQQLSVLAVRLRPHLAELRDRFNETVCLAALDGFRICYVDVLDSPNGVRLTARPGDVEHLHSTALGKAIASIMDAKRVEVILAADGMPRRTARTITSIEAFMREMEKVAAEGHAVDDRENEIDSRCVAVPLTAAGLPAAISISAPAPRFSMQQLPAAADALKACAALLHADTTRGAATTPGMG
ncbi:IclR family transcriptional regulator [Phytoactinopolyspora alkaliphila]|uniref:IclR family transcriptional regulator n=1 Tax=Phytoactinopolyspora alkaliphila TaxID=1783498 RepID=A0A6N9YNJ3_9ACTN|nr:IclR family transcriptional regulator [Phytoactinopolyspora alkaliphila]NED96408.1 IclR family transcriptional regulator [Phytoactinopolyspora alkaliphila]